MSERDEEVSDGGRGKKMNYQEGEMKQGSWRIGRLRGENFGREVCHKASLDDSKSNSPSRSTLGFLSYGVRAPKVRAVPARNDLHTRGTPARTHMPK